jgi:hypothetical protein
LLGLAPPEGAEGFALLPEPTFPRSRELHYHLIAADYTDAVLRFVFEGESMRFDRVLRRDGFYDELPLVEVGEVSEAEHCVITETEDTHLESDPFSSGEYVQGGGVSLRVQVTEQGTYGLSVRFRCSGDGPVEITASTNERDYEAWELGACEEWEWHTAPFHWVLTPGDHVLTVRQDEGGLLDQLVLKRI